MSITMTSYKPSLTPIALYNSEQVYAIEQDWFAKGYNSFALMQQAAWQMAQRIVELQANNSSNSNHLQPYIKAQSLTTNKRALIWAGQGNNGGDGWLIAWYLQQAGWQVQVITVGIERIIPHQLAQDLSDAQQAQRKAINACVPYQRFEDGDIDSSISQADIYIDAIFGIGLDRAPEGHYKQAITTFNQLAKQTKALVAAVDIPSGLQASTGQVVDGIAIKAEVTFCLVARKLGLHTSDGMDYAGHVFDIPLIPITATAPTATLLTTAYALAPRQQNSYKGSYGHVLIIGGNRIDGSQGMGGAAILSASSAMTTGAGKITVACHTAFHGALLASLPDAMTLDLQDMDSVKALIKEASVVTIGMGLGRDDNAKALFITYLAATIAANKAIVIDADGLYHLASLQQERHKLIQTLKDYSTQQKVYLTPHSGEAARLLDIDIEEIEADRIQAITQGAKCYGGDWVLKGAGSVILEQQAANLEIYICAVGNAGMASAGMGDILSGVCAGLIAQLDLTDEARSLRQAVLIHGLAGDALLERSVYQALTTDMKTSIISQRGMQAQNMPAAIRYVMSAMEQEV